MKDINFDILGDYEDCIINISRNKRSRLLIKKIFFYQKTGVN